MISRFLREPALVLSEVERWESGSEGSREMLARTLADAERRLKRNHREESNLLEQRTREDDDGDPLISDEAFREGMARVKRDRKDHTENIEQLRSRLALQDSQRVTVAQVEAVREQMCERLDTADLELKQWVLEQLQAKVQVWKDRVLVEIAVGVPVGEVSTIPSCCG